MRGTDAYIPVPDWLTWLVRGYARGDRELEAALVKALQNVAAEGSIRAAARGTTIHERALQRHVRKVRELAGGRGSRTADGGTADGRTADGRTAEQQMS